MATPKLKNSPGRGTLLPRRNASRPGMGGTNTQDMMQQGRPDSLMYHPLQGNIASMLNQLGLTSGQQGFGFNQHQQDVLSPELERINQFMGSNPRAAENFTYNPGYGIVGNIRNFEHQLGMQGPGKDFGGLNADMAQKAMFARATGYEGPMGHVGGPIQHGQGGPPGQHHPGPGPGHTPPIFQPPWESYGGPGQLGQYQGVQPQNPGQQLGPPQQGPTPYQPNPGQQMGYDVQPGYGQPVGYGNGQQPGPAQFGPAMGYNGPRPGPGQQFGPPQMGGGGMPPFQGAPTGAMATSPQSGPATAPQSGNPFGFQPLQLPGWNQSIQSYYGELPGQPTYLTGAGLNQQQALMNQLSTGLAGLSSQYGQIAPQYNEQGQRLMTNYGVDRQNLTGQMADAGIFGGGLSDQNFQNQQTDYNRQFQDLQQQAAAQVAQLQAQAAGLFGDTGAGLAGIYANDAVNQAQNPNAPYKKPTPKTNKKNGKKGS